MSAKAPKRKFPIATLIIIIEINLKVIHYLLYLVK